MIDAKNNEKWTEFSDIQLSRTNNSAGSANDLRRPWNLRIYQKLAKHSLISNFSMKISNMKTSAQINKCSDRSDRNITTNRRTWVLAAGKLHVHLEIVYLTCGLLCDTANNSLDAFHPNLQLHPRQLLHHSRPHKISNNSAINQSIRELTEEFCVDMLSQLSLYSRRFLFTFFADLLITVAIYSSPNFPHF